MSLAGLLLDTPCEYIFMNWKQQDGTLIHLVTLDGSQVRLGDGTRGYQPGLGHNPAGAARCW